MEQAKTHLGTPELHKRKSVMIEGGLVPRARVMNQHMIDQYLMDGKINFGQHMAGEYLLGQAARAGVWPTGVNLSETRVTGAIGNFVPFGAFPFGRTLVTVRKRYGDFHAYLVCEVVVHDWDVSKSTSRMGCLRESLDWISERRMGGGRDPVRLLRRAIKKRGAKTHPAGNSI